MVDGVAMALGSLKAASETAKAMLELRDAAKIGEATITLQGQISAAQSMAIAAQSEHAALVQEIDDLKKKIVRFETWESEKKRYSLQDHGGGTFAYVLKEEMRDGQTLHKICANCYQDSQISILQNKGGNYNGREIYRCPKCTNDFPLGKYEYKTKTIRL